MVVVTRYDSVDRVTAQQVGDVPGPGRTTTYVYDSLFLRTVTDPAGHVYTQESDALGHVTKAYAADTTGWYRTYRYDALGRQTSVTNRRGQIVQLAYDELGRLTWRRYLSGGALDTLADVLSYRVSQADTLVAARDFLDPALTDLRVSAHFGHQMLKVIEMAAGSCAYLAVL